MQLIPAQAHQLDAAMEIIDEAKRHLRDQGIDQWQTGYPGAEHILGDMRTGKGFFVEDAGDILGYLCVDFGGEPAYDALNGQWHTDEPYVVVHRMAFSGAARGRGLSDAVFGMVEAMSRERGVYSFRVDTDADNRKMRHILEKNGFTFRGTICFDNSEKLAYDKRLERMP